MLPIDWPIFELHIEHVFNFILKMEQKAVKLMEFFDFQRKKNMVFVDNFSFFSFALRKSIEHYFRRKIDFRSCKTQLISYKIDDRYD